MGLLCLDKDAPPSYNKSTNGTLPKDYCKG